MFQLIFGLLIIVFVFLIYSVALLYDNKENNKGLEKN
jgi:CHASE3 domain sensor protein